jgi:hypothetical protein
MLGLSATPDENPLGFDRVVWWEIGPVIDAQDIPGYESISVDFSADVQRIMYYGDPAHTAVIKNETTDMINVAGTINQVCEDEHRNALVIQCIEQCIDARHSTFVFADRRDYLEKLRQQLHVVRKAKKSNDFSADVVASDEEFTRIVGGAKLEELSRAEKHAHVIFSTYQYIGTGKSIPRMTALVLATPRKTKMKQYIGRIFRLGSDATIRRQVYDIVDMKVVLKNQYTTRKKYYDEKKYPITESKALYTDYTPIVLPDIKLAVTDNTSVQKKTKPTVKLPAKKTNTVSIKKHIENIDVQKISSVLDKLLCRK